MIIIVGAGLGGLVCAKMLHEAGRQFLLLEASDRPGGRVRTFEMDGFVLDRGFQVLLDSYPAARRHLDFEALKPRYFAEGALLWDKEGFNRVMHPLKHPEWILSDVLTPAFSGADKFHFASLAAGCLLHTDAALLSRCGRESDESSMQLLRRLGFSDRAIDGFFRPFFGGVFLDDELETSGGLLCYYLKHFASGRVMVPSAGMGAIPQQLASSLPRESIRYQCAVRHLHSDASRVTGVVTDSGETLPVSSLVLATDEPATATLLGNLPLTVRPARKTSTVYFKCRQPLYTGGLLVLPAGTGRFVRHLVQISNIAPEFSPDGWHLISASVLDRGDGDDESVARRAALEIEEIFTEARGLLKPVAVVDVPYAQIAQPRGFAAHLPNPALPANVILAGDQTGVSSIQGAMESGERAASALTQH